MVKGQRGLDGSSWGPPVRQVRETSYVGSPSFECQFRFLEEGIGEWGSGVETEWDWGTKEKGSPPCSSLLSEKTEAVVVRMRTCRESLPLARSIVAAACKYTPPPPIHCL